MNYYNENDPKAAAWLLELIRSGLIPDGKVDERSIADVQPGDLEGFTQCHFFAGIGGWSYALQLAGWPSDRPVWTGSCPCQPFSVASNNKAEGTGDRRDLWSLFCELIGQRKPSTVFGEQVKNAISWAWWDRAKMDLEAKTYAAAAAVLRGDAIGAIHQRKRLYWVADSSGKGRERPEQAECFSSRTEPKVSIDGYAFAKSRSAVEGDWSDLLLCHGLSIGMARIAIKGFGNAIIPQVAAQFIRAYMET